MSGKRAPCSCLGNPLHLRKFPLHFQSCLKVLRPLQQFLFPINFFWKFSKTLYVFYPNLEKHKKSHILLKRLQTFTENVHECKSKVKLLFLKDKKCKITTFFICRGFCRDPLTCSGFIQYRHFAGGKSSTGSMLNFSKIISEDLRQR